MFQEGADTHTWGASRLVSWFVSWPLAIVAPLAPVPLKAGRAFSFLLRRSVSVVIGMAEHLGVAQRLVNMYAHSIGQQCV